MVLFIFVFLLSVFNSGVSGQSGETPQKQFICPVDSGKFTSGFGQRMHPVLKVKKHHDGIDIAAPEGQSVCASEDGQILYTGFNKGFGKMIKIGHSNNFTTVYAQLNDILVETGNIVKQGEKIGTVGATGLSTAPHLHFEIRINGEPVNPADYIDLRNVNH